MDENAQNLISAIASGNTIASSAALSTAFFGKIAEKMDARRKEIAKSMFKESTGDLDEASAIVTKQNTDGTYDEVGTNNRGIMKGSLSKIKSQAKDRFGKNHRIELFHGDHVGGKPHTTLHIKESIDEAKFDPMDIALKVNAKEISHDLGMTMLKKMHSYTHQEASNYIKHGNKNPDNLK